MADEWGFVTPGASRFPAAFQSRYGVLVAPSSTNGYGSIEPPGSADVDWHWMGPDPLRSRNGPRGDRAEAAVRQNRPRPLGSSDVSLTLIAEYENQVSPILATAEAHIARLIHVP